jgi:hemoglobin
MKRSIQTPEDIRFLVNSFYEQVLVDPEIGFIFTEVAQINMETHMPVMYQFWESILLGKMNYKGNPMIRHIELHKKVPLTKAHFERWESLFFQTIDQHFEGEKAELAKQRAQMMGQLMQFKISQSDQKGFIQ